jgi:hypothetical protein
VRRTKLSSVLNGLHHSRAGISIVLLSVTKRPVAQIHAQCVVHRPVGLTTATIDQANLHSSSPPLRGYNPPSLDGRSGQCCRSRSGSGKTQVATCHDSPYRYHKRCSTGRSCEQPRRARSLPSALPFLSSKQRDVSECKHRERDRDHHRRNQGSKRDVWSPAIEQGCRKKIGAQCDWSKPVKQRKTASEEAERRTDRSADKPEPSTRGQEGQSESRRCQNHGGPAEDHCRPPLNHIASLRGSRLLRHQFRMVGFMTRQRHKTHRGEDRCFPRCPPLILPLGALQ